MISPEVCQTEDKMEMPKKAHKTRYKVEQCKTCGNKIVYVEQCKTCGSKIVYVNRSRHRRSRKHKDAEYLWHDMLEAS